MYDSQWSVSVVTPPASEPLTLTDAKAHLRVTHSAEDDLITTMITVARQVVEKYTGRTLPETTLKLTLDCLPYEYAAIQLPRSPVSSVSSFQYVDTEGATQTLASSQYDVDIARLPARVYAAYNVSWPSVRPHRAAINITYVAGGGDIPEALIHAMKLIIASLYSHREADCPMQTYQPTINERYLMDPYVIKYWGYVGR